LAGRGRSRHRIRSVGQYWEFASLLTGKRI
jgi:hypothetical protein